VTDSNCWENDQEGKFTAAIEDIAGEWMVGLLQIDFFLWRKRIL